MMLVNSSSFLSRVHVYNARVNVYKTRDIAFRRVSITRVICVFSQVAVTPRAEIPWRGLSRRLGVVKLEEHEFKLRQLRISKGEYKNCSEFENFLV